MFHVRGDSMIQSNTEELNKRIHHLEITLRQLSDRLEMQQVINETLERQLHNQNPYNRDNKKSNTTHIVLLKEIR